MSVKAFNFICIDSINDLYEYLLQREYTGHVPLAEHQMERKAVRSPSLRLRFGRRSDPGMPLVHESEQDVDKRAPSARLRWGKREMGFFNEVRSEIPVLILVSLLTFKNITECI